MAHQTTRRRTGGTGGRQRTVAAAARAAAKRAERGRQAEAESTERAEAPGASKRSARAGRDAAAPASEGTARPTVRKPRTRDTADPAAVPNKKTTAASPARRSDLLRAGLAVLVLAGLVATVLLGLQYREARQSERAGREATAAARTMAPLILSYDHRRLDRDFAAARKHLTGAFRAEYGRTTSKVVAPTAKKYKGSVKATIARPPGGQAPAVSVVSATPERVVVLMFMNQITESSKISNPRVDLNRVRMTLVRTSDGWKASAVDAL